MSKVPKILSQYILPGKVTVFSITNCPYCSSASNLLKDLKVDFNYYQVNTDEKFNNTDFKTSLTDYCGIRTYPKILIGETCIGGYTDLSKLYKTQKLFKMLKKEGIKFEDDDLF